MLKAICELCDQTVEVEDAYGQGAPQARHSPNWQRPYEFALRTREGKQIGGHWWILTGDPNSTICGACMLDGMEEALKLAGRLPRDVDPTEVIEPVDPVPHDHTDTSEHPHLHEVPATPDVQAARPDVDPDATQAIDTPDDEELVKRHFRNHLVAQVAGDRPTSRVHDHHGTRYKRGFNGTCEHCREYPTCRPESELPPLADLRGSGGSPGPNGEPPG